MDSKDKFLNNLADADRQHGEAARSSLRELKQKAVMAASRYADPKADAREAFGFMPMSMKGASIRWRGF
jgi:hypothetical protein